MNRVSFKVFCLGLIAICFMSSCCSKAQDNGSNPVIETIMNRKSVRSYTSQKVSHDQVMTLLRAAMAAPSGRNMQPWRFVVVDNPDTLKILADSLPYAKMLKEASVAIVVCGEMNFVNHRNNDQLEPNKNWTADCAAATENLLIAVESMGLGAVWTASWPYEERYSAVSRTLGIPDGVMPYCVVPIGYPAGENKPKDKWKPENVHFNKW